MRIIPRRIDIKRIQSAGPWRMIYGRRKTGKTFLVENFLSYDRFFFVNRDGTLIDRRNFEKYTYGEFIRLFRELIDEKLIVIDEFHRLPEDFQDFLHSLGVRGRLILITSTLWLAEKLLGRGSPLLGLVYPIRIGLIDERDILLELSKELRGKMLIEACVYLREPSLIPFFKPPLRRFISNFLFENRFFIRELIGEIFTEEERELTNVYEGILKAIASGRNVSTEISTLLFSRGLISKDNPGVLQKYLSILVTMGLLNRVKVYGKKRYRYFHVSPLFDLHFYLEDKYSYSELDVPVDFIRRVVEVKLPLHVELYIRNLLSKVMGLSYQRIEEKDFEVDIALFEFKRLKLVGEVKWKDYVSRSEVRGLEEKLNRFKGVRRVIVVPDVDVLEREPEEIEVLDVDGIVELVSSGVEV
ncbi:MAG: AAA family ATPase [archaeon GB-1867-035]|nr:AAA family ATPase [Candidatus Culexmicrobium profundum]